jgi:PAS domain S-box-containing protein
VVEPVDGKLAATERSEERFRRIVHCADEGIWEIDALGFITFVNPKMAALLGCASTWITSRKSTTASAT